MSDALARKLAQGADLTAGDVARLGELTRMTRGVGPRQDLIRQGERPAVVHLVLDGLACRYKVLSGGKRRNLALLVPGDLSDLHAPLLSAMDHSVATLSACAVVDIPRHAILDLIENHPRIAKALRWAALAEAGIAREWLVGMSLREAGEQMAHLFCELLVRLRMVGLADGNGYALPLTQPELAETLGITSVHVNRTLQVLRAAGLVTLKGRRLTILDVHQLMALCDFDPSYLHLARRERDWRHG